MFLKAPGGREVALCYSMNVHPGEGLDDVLAALESSATPLRERLSPGRPFAVGLRLARRAAEETERRAGELKEALDRHGLRAVTVNAFPYGDFHAARVKEDVYRPDWTEAARAVYSLRAAVALAAVGARGSEASVSTVPLSWRAWSPSLNALTGRVLDMVNALQNVERKSGVRVKLALEPEPGCVLESARDAIAYWRDHLMPACRARYGRGADDLAQAYLGVCLDTCHHAVVWEDAAEAVDAYVAAGVPVAKVQLSAALEAVAPEDLSRFAEPRYLHQIVSRDGSARSDLPADGMRGPVRCHFHVPVHLAEVGGVATTRDSMASALRRALETGATSCFEIETYTWEVLPEREGPLLDSLESEYRFVLEEAAKAGFSCC